MVAGELWRGEQCWKQRNNWNRQFNSVGENTYLRLLSCAGKGMGAPAKEFPGERLIVLRVGNMKAGEVWAQTKRQWAQGSFQGDSSSLWDRGNRSLHKSASFANSPRSGTWQCRMQLFTVSKSSWDAAWKQQLNRGSGKMMFGDKREGSSTIRYLRELICLCIGDR